MLREERCDGRPPVLDLGRFLFGRFAAGDQCGDRTGLADALLYDVSKGLNNLSTILAKLLAIYLQRQSLEFPQIIVFECLEI